MASKRTFDHSSCFPAPKQRKVSSCFASSSSSTQPRWSYDVFLSFRGKDTRKNFTDHLYEALVQAGIHTFRDDDELPRGREISSVLLKSIEVSRISIVVFSRNYASSRWCLDELVKIIKCKKTLGQLLLPIFYDVDPSDVRHQTGYFGEAFGRHEKRFADETEKVEVRRAALSEAANISGWDLQIVANGYEAKFIRNIVKEVLYKLKHTCLNVAVHPVGIDSRVKRIKSLMSIESDDVRMIGIYGLGGIGKTTIAKAVYNHLSFQFEGSCFLADVRECAGQFNGLAQLQEQLLFELLGIKDLKIGSVDRGMNLIKERLSSKRVLIVLDDLDQLHQLNSLAGNRDWFGPGSRIIITTRDEQLLKGLKVDERYMAKELNHTESLQLFNWHAFGETNPLENYADLIGGIVSYASGLPLALEVLGSYLYGRDKVTWKSAFDKLQQIPHAEIQKKLRISFDALDDDNTKDIFLDVACFFIGMDKDYVTTILNGCGFFPEIGISVLISKCLLRTNEENKLTMHDLLRDMGREIIREKYPKEPEKRSRLWFHDDVCEVLAKNKGTKAVEGVILTLPMLKKIQWSNESFASMPKLRLLQINHVHLSGNFEHLLEELRWLYWHNCPLEYLPSNFHPKKLLVLDMQFSRFKTLWRDGKQFKSLKILNLSNSKCLTRSPIFYALSMLEELHLENCTSLTELHKSIGLLDKLVHLNLKDCMNLKYLPGSICKLNSVERLNLIGCAKLEEFPKHLGHMESLTELLADETAIKQLPSSIGLLKNLRSLSLNRCNRQLTTESRFSLISSWVLPRKKAGSIRFLPSSISGLCFLTELYLRDCNLSEGDFPADLTSLSSLRSLDVGRNNFRSLPYGFSHLSKLEELLLDECTSLESLSDLPPHFLRIDACDCPALEIFFCVHLSSHAPQWQCRLKILWLSNDLFQRILSNRNNDGMENRLYFEGAQIIPLGRLNNIQNQFKVPHPIPSPSTPLHPRCPESEKLPNNLTLSRLSSNTSQSFTQWRFPLPNSPISHHSHPPPPPESNPSPPKTHRHFYPQPPPPELFHLAELQLTSDSDSDRLNGTLLIGSSSVPYFMLVAVEAGSLLRGLILLLSFPLIAIAYIFISEALAIQALIFISYAELKICDIELVSRTVLPRFFAADVRAESYDVFEKCERKVVVTANPTVMVEPFVRDYLEADMVLGTEIEVVEEFLWIEVSREI